MKLYCDPVSTTSRPVLMFVADQALDVEIVKIDLLAGGHTAPAYLDINPNGIVPYLVDGDFAVGECAAILKYLAIRAHATAHPEGLRAQVKVDEAISWFRTRFHDAFCNYACYPAMGLPHGMTNEFKAALMAYGREQSRRWLTILNDHMLAAGPYVCGDMISLADYMGLSFCLLGELVDFDFSPYPNITGWLGRMRARPSFVPTYAAFETMAGFLRSQQQAA
jgi:glutathione S-transferase